MPDFKAFFGGFHALIYDPLQYVVYSLRCNHNILWQKFSNIIKKSNLNADMQAVREMNEALAEWEAANGYPSHDNMKIEDAMKIIADAGYDADSWIPLTKGYQVYWFKTDNRCLLYNASEKKVIYPSEYSNTDLRDDKNAGLFYVYNQTNKKALSQDLSFSSNSNKNITVGDTTYSSALVTTSGDTINYASAIVYQEDGHETTFTVSVKKVGNPTESDIKSAQKAAGEYVYAIFQQANEKLIKLEEVIIEPGTIIDISDITWKPIKEFSGYFGSKDPENPVHINGLSISSALSFTETYIAKGSSNPIYLTGFIGAVYDEATIENVVFENVTIDHAAADRLKSSSDKDASNSAIIGGIVSGEFKVYDENGIYTETKLYPDANVTIKNVTVSNCVIKAVRRAAGLVGFIGGTDCATKSSEIDAAHIGTKPTVCALGGTVIIEDCKIENTTIDTDAITAGQSSYGVAGGVVGFINKDSDLLTVLIKNCQTINCNLNGNTSISGGIVGEMNSTATTGSTLTIENCSVSGNKNNGTALDTLVNVKGKVNAISINGSTITAAGSY